MQHPTQENIHDFLNSRLEEPKTRSINEHLNTCADCRLTIDKLIVDSLDTNRPTANSTKDGSSVNSELADGFPKFELGHRFLVRDEIARGGMGIVYRGFDRELKREVAIKVLQKDQSGAAHRFHREAQILGQIQHPGIVPIHETGRLRDGRMFIAMKLVEGQTLRGLIENSEGFGNRPELLGVFGQVCETLAYAHSKNVVHRDLKPENVMVGSFGEVQVMDWGLAKKLADTKEETDQSTVTSDPHDDLPQQLNGFKSASLQNSKDANPVPMSPLVTQLGDVFGSPAYMSPEQAHGQSADRRTDVFAIGGILFFLLTGKAPFEAPSQTKALAKSRNHDMSELKKELANKELDSELIEIVQSCLSPQVENRPNDAGEVNELFKKFLSNREQQFEKDRIDSARASERLIAQQKRNRQVVWFSGAIIVALLATTVTGFLYLTEKNRRQSEIANTKLEQLKRQSEAENQIRVNLSSAENFQRLAIESDSDVGSEHWRSALFEIKQAKSLANESISETLRSELVSIDSEVQAEADLFFGLRTRKEQEFACREEVRETCYQSLYPPSLRMALLGRLSEQFADAYEKIGITPGELSDEVVTRLAQSEYKAFLMHGLLFWRVEIGRESRRFGPRDDDDSNRRWIDELLTKADQDPLRKKIRAAVREKNFQRLAPLLKKKEAIESLATVLLCTPLVEFLETPEDQINYLLRAQQAFPDEFQLKWKLSAVNGLNDEAKKELGFRAALACYALQPRNPAVLMNLGATYIQQENYDLAVQLLEQVVQVAPNFSDAQYNLANAYWRGGQPELAIRSCEKILTISKDHFWATLLRGLVCEELGHIDEAIVDFKRAAKLNPKHNSAHHQLFKLYRDRNELEEAADYLRQAVEIQPKNVGYQKELGSLYIVMKKWDLAKATFETILDFKPKDVTALASLANLHLSRNHPEQSESLLREAIYNGVNNHTIQLELAKALLGQSADGAEPDKQREGLQILKKLIELAPKLKSPAEILRKHKESQQAAKLARPRT